MDISDGMKWDALDIIKRLLEKRTQITKATFDKLPEVYDLFQKYGFLDISLKTLPNRVSELLRELKGKGRGKCGLIEYKPSGMVTSQKIIFSITPFAEEYLTTPEYEREAADASKRFLSNALSENKRQLERFVNNSYLSHYKSNLDLLINQVELNIDKTIPVFDIDFPKAFDIGYLDTIPSEEIVEVLSSVPLFKTEAFCWLLFYREHPLLGSIMTILVKRYFDEWFDKDFDRTYTLYLLDFLLNETTRTLPSRVQEVFNQDPRQRMFWIKFSLSFLQSRDSEASKQFFDYIPDSWYDYQPYETKVFNWRENYFDFLLLMKDFNPLYYQKTITPFLNIIALQSANDLLAILPSLYNAYSSKDDLYSQVPVFDHLKTAFQQCKKLIVLFHQLDRTIEQLAFSTEELTRIIDSMRERILMPDHQEFISTLIHARWDSFGKSHVLRESLKRIDFEIIISNLNKIQSGTQFGEALLGISKSFETINWVQEVITVHRVNELLENIISFEDYRFLIYGLEVIRPQIFNELDFQKYTKQVAQTIKKDDLSRLAWFYVQYREKYPKLIIPLFKKVFHRLKEEIMKLDEDLLIFLRILYENKSLSPEIIQRLSIELRLDFMKRFVMYNREFTAQFLKTITFETLLEFIDSHDIAVKLFFCEYLWNSGISRFQEVVKNTKFDLDDVTIEELSTEFTPRDLSWMKETHPQEYSKVIKASSIRDLRMLVEYSLPPVDPSFLQ